VYVLLRQVLQTSAQFARDGGAKDVEILYICVLATRPVPIPAGKRLAAVTLPADTDIHVFAVAAS
jgi:hypothetical protein